MELMLRHPMASWVDRIITHRFRLKDVEKAIKKSMEPDAMKVVIAPWGECQHE
jgi:threonine dehydrogenase-like Zn-dependent dehydrogenase